MHGSRTASTLTALGVGWLVRHSTSRAVRSWAPGGGRRRSGGALTVRAFGEGPAAVLLLHGLVGSGAYWGDRYDRLAAFGTVLVPDLLGFGGSMSPSREDFSLTAHLESLDEAVRPHVTDNPPGLTVVGHSMGAVLAACWAARNIPLTAQVIMFNPPLYVDAAETRRQLSHLGIMERFFATETPLARAACAWMCAHRGAAAIVATVISARLPIPIARNGVLHTWPAYLGGLNEVIGAGRWEAALAQLDAAGIAVLLVEGADDRVPVPGRCAELAGRWRTVSAERVPRAGHDLPLSWPDSCVAIIEAVRAARPAAIRRAAGQRGAQCGR